MASLTAHHRARAIAFSDDAPLLSPEGDRLGRLRFAQALATAISGWHGKHGLVIGVFGPWGAGKTTLMNFACHFLGVAQRNGSHGPIVIRYNPWSYSHRADMTEAFFDQVGRALSRKQEPDGTKEIGRRFRDFAKYLRVGSAAIDLTIAIYDIAVLLLMVAAAFIPHPFWRVLAAAVVALLGVLLRLSSKVRAVLEKLATLIETATRPATPPLSERKKQLADILRASPVQLVVVFDDVDRLTAAEMSEVLQLVKVNADFPNVVYVLLAERGALERSVEQAAPVSGRAFLDKIFQVQFDVPLPHARHVSEFLTRRLDELLAPFGDWTHEQQSRWHDIYISGLLPHFTTLRDANRFLSAFEFQLGVFITEGVPEVSLIDFIAVEVLRHFEPDAYARIPRLKHELLTDHEAPVAPRGGVEAAKAAVDALIGLAPEQNTAALRQVVRCLFPQAAKLLGDQLVNIDEASWVRDRRVCAQAYFDRYFAIALREDELSELDRAFISDHLADTDALLEHLLSIQRRGLLRELLDRLEAHKQALPLDHAPTFVAALMKFGDTLAPEPVTLESDTEMRLIRVVHWYLMQSKDAEQRGRFLREAIKASGALRIAASMVGMELDRHARNKDVNDSLLAEAQLDEVRALMREVFESHASDGSLAKISGLGRTLFNWQRIAGAEPPRKWVAELVATPNGALALIAGLVQRGYSYTGRERLGRLRVNIYIEELERLIDLATLELAIDAARGEKMSDTEREALSAFDRAVARKRSGLSDSIRTEDDDLQS